jgi:hypothetical protein
MTDTISDGGQRSFGWLRWVGWGGALALLVLPLVAMRVAPDSGVNWTFSDFVFAGLMFGAVGLAAETAVRISRNWAYRGGAALGLAAGFLLVWSNAAVGYIGDDNPYNLTFFMIVALALAGSVLVRFRAGGMALVMLAAGIAHAVAGAIGYPQDPVTGPITIVFTGMWLASAGLFHKAAKEGATD